MNKLIGYIISVVGIIVLALSFAQIRTMLKLNIPLSDTILMIIGGVIIVVGIFFIVRGTSSRKVSEVPIYQGKDVVGYRRM